MSNTPGYQMIAWDKKSKAILGFFQLNDQGETLIGRHCDNHLTLDHPEISQFHLVTRPKGSALELHCVPGSMPLIYLGRFIEWHKVLQEKINGRPQKRMLSLGHSRFRLNQLHFEFLGPQSICKRHWPAPHCKPTEKTSKPCTKVASKKHPALTLPLSLLCLCFGLAWLLESNKPPVLPPPPRNHHHFDPTPTPFPSLVIPAPVTTAHLAQIDISPPLKPAHFAPKSSILKHAKSNFLKGEEEQAIQILLDSYRLNPFSEPALAHAQFAKSLQHIRSHRQTAVWESQFKEEKEILGEVSKTTLKLALHHWSEQARHAFEKGNFAQAKALWERSLVWNKNDHQAHAGLHQLEIEAKNQYRRAYVIAALDPAKANEILASTLQFTPSGNPLQEKIRGWLQKDAHKK